jgi:hypothetical protein
VPGTGHGEEGFDREWSTGAALPLDEVLDDARALAGTSARAAPDA